MSAVRAQVKMRMMETQRIVYAILSPNRWTLLLGDFEVTGKWQQLLAYLHVNYSNWFRFQDGTCDIWVFHHQLLMNGSPKMNVDFFAYEC